MVDMEKTTGTELSDEQIEKMTAQQIRTLMKENDRLRQELRVRDNDILSHDQVFDSIVSGTLHVILVMSVTRFTAEFVTSNVETAFGINRAAVMEDVRRIGHSFDDIEKYNGKEETFIHQTNGARRQYLVYVIHLPYGRSDRVAVVLLCRTNAAKGDLEEMMLRQTEDVNRAAGYFLASLSQEFHMPINVISGFVMLLMKNADNPAKVMEYAHRISQACQEILTTFDQIVDMSWSESMRASLEEEEFGLNLMVQEVATIISSLARARNLEFYCLPSGIEYDIVAGDRTRIMEMLRLLLSNAVKYTPPGGRVELKVTSKPDEEEETTDLLFEVRDNGIGMEPDQLRKFFVEEVPADSINGPARGAGIWMIRKVVSMMNGTISVDSSPGEGTAIRIRLKLKLISSGISCFWSRHGIRRMLIVDKGIQEAARVKNLMGNAGVKSAAVSSSYGMIKTIEQSSAADQEFDLILLDEDMQDISWREAVSTVRRMSWIHRPYIFLMTERPIPEEEYRGQGIDQVLQKPFTCSALRKVVGEVCAQENADSQNPEEEEDQSMAGLRFLAAEDNMINAEMLRDLLEMNGARCEIAGNGRAALAKFSNSKPGTYDVILMDTQMPVMDGYAAATAIRGLAREDAESVPIIAMTANTMEEDVSRIYEAGINSHIRKPMSIRTLQKHLRRVYRK
jgi:signal transduction histidine kinase/CheY-like chemotaxis protein